MTERQSHDAVLRDRGNAVAQALFGAELAALGRRETAEVLEVLRTDEWKQYVPEELAEPKPQPRSTYVAPPPRTPYEKAVEDWRKAVWQAIKTDAEPPPRPEPPTLGDPLRAVSTMEAAEFALVGPSTIRVWAHRGHLSPAVDDDGNPIVDKRGNAMYRLIDVFQAKRSLSRNKPRK